MALNLREQVKSAVDAVPEQHLPTIIRWLELLAATKDHDEIEPEELWLLASGELKAMNDEVADAKEIGDWRD